MTRLCERPGCSDRAEVAYGFDAPARTVWLDSLTAQEDARSGALCRRHADAMGVPLGWTLDDRREPVPRLFRSDVTAAPAPSPAGPPPVRRRVDRAPAAEQLRFDTDDGPSNSELSVATDATDVATPGPGEPLPTDPVDVAPWVPQFDQHDDLHGLLDATGPLLSRAFGGHHRPDC